MFAKYFEQPFPTLVLTCSATQEQYNFRAGVSK